MLEKINIAKKLGLFNDTANPRLVGQVNDTAVKLVKLSGEFVWHHHELEDELFLVIEGVLEMHYRFEGKAQVLELQPGEFVIVPHGLEHKPVTKTGCSIMLVEPASTLNTGNVVNERTRTNLERL